MRRRVLRGTQRRMRRTVLDGVAALLRGHLAPLPAQFRTLFRRHLPEAIE